MAFHVLSVSSQVACGPVGNSAAAPGMESLGLVVHQVPTVILSNHPGLGKPSGFRVGATGIDGILTALEGLGVLQRCSAVLTGYFVTPEQVSVVAHAIRRMKEAKPRLYYLCDPVIGDDPAGLYVPLPVAEAIRDEFLPIADAAAPNRFELEWLSQNAVSSIPAAVQAARNLPCPEVLTTSIPNGDSSIATLSIVGETVAGHSTAKLGGVPHGTGDLLSGLYLAHRVKGAGPSESLSSSMRTLHRVIAASDGDVALNLVEGLRCSP